MDILNLSPDALKPYENNPRKVEAAIEKVADSIRAFGFRQPIVVDEAMVLIIGHVRLEAAKRLGLESVPVHIAKDLGPEQVQALRLADNRVGEWAEWDAERLAFEIDQLDDMGFDLSVLGFTSDEMASLLAGLQASGQPVADEMDLDDAPSAPADPTTCPGDVYQIGPHVLVCGDATRLDDYKRLQGTDKAQMVFTDPPYNVDYEGGTSDRLTILNDAMSEDEFLQFLRAFFFAARWASEPGCPIYVCHADVGGGAFRIAMTQTKWLFKQCLIWAKSSITLGRQDYQYKHEPILYGWKGGAAHPWYAGRKETTIWEFEKPRRNDLHPTMKPVALVKKAIENSSQAGDLVMDPFGGSGTTMVAAQETGRRARLLELDPRYCDVIVARMLKLWPSLKVTRNGEPVGG